MNINLSDEAIEFGRVARQALEAAGGDELVQRAEQDPEHRADVVSTVLGNIFRWSGKAFYPFYAAGEKAHGVTPLQDQGWAGTVMMLEGSLVTLAALAWLFLKLAAEGELKQELIERGVDPQVAKRAVRYGRGAELRPPA